MKKLLPILLLFLSLKLSAQDSTYISMITDGYEWYYGRQCCGSEGPGQIQCGDVHYKMTLGDSFTYNNKQYKILNFWNGWYSLQTQTTTYDPSQVSPYALIREDSGMVYVNYGLGGDSCNNCYSNTDPVDNEFVLYDFNLLPGDTFYLPYLSTYFADCDTNNFLTVVAVDSIEIGSIYRKIIKLKSDFSDSQSCPSYQFDRVEGVQHGDTLYWIEGIGSNKGLMYHISFEETYGSLIQCDISFMCHKQAGTYIYGVGTCEFAVGIEEEVDFKSIDIYPNPTDNSITVKLLIKFSSCTLQIIDLQGRVVKTETLSGNSQTIATDNLPGGVYQLIVSSKDKLFGREKLVVVR